MLIEQTVAIDDIFSTAFVYHLATVGVACRERTLRRQEVATSREIRTHWARPYS